MITFRPGNLKTFNLTGSLPQNVNQSLKSAQIAAFLARIPEANAKIPINRPPKTHLPPKPSPQPRRPPCSSTSNPEPPTSPTTLA